MSRTELSQQVYDRLQQIYVLLDDGDRRSLAPVGLTPTQYNLLRRLDRPDAASMTVTGLAAALLCTRGNVTRLVQRLQQLGLVRTVADPDDQRLVRVALTEEGARRLAAARAVHTAVTQRRLGGLDREQLRALRDLTAVAADLLAKDLIEHPADSPPASLRPGRTP
ncbi:MAG TPA: MarR family transcriptional regulator [Micromonosporaceae bacterium]